MKAAKRKAIKQLASILPDAFYVRPHTERMPVWEAYRANDNGAEIEGLPELTDDTKDLIVSVKTQGLEQMNHYRGLKRAMAKDPIDGARKYILRVHGVVSRMGGDSEQVDTKLVELARLKNGFWKRLIAFLFAFVTSFKTAK